MDRSKRIRDSWLPVLTVSLLVFTLLAANARAATVIYYNTWNDAKAACESAHGSC